MTNSSIHLEEIEKKRQLQVLQILMCILILSMGSLVMDFKCYFLKPNRRDAINQ